MVTVSIRILTDDERRELELEIDREHKPLTDIERSKQYVRKAAQTASALREKAAQLEPPFGSNSRGGPKPKDGVRQKDVADAAGIGLTTLKDAKAHVAAVTEFPDPSCEPAVVGQLLVAADGAGEFVGAGPATSPGQRHCHPVCLLLHGRRDPLHQAAHHPLAVRRRGRRGAP